MCPRSILAVLVSLAACAAPRSEAPRPAADRPADPTELARAVERVERLDRLRSSLASTFDDPTARPDRATFLVVCKPVGVEAARIARENGWAVEQLSEKYRNPDHAPDPEAREAIDRFERVGALDGQWIRTVRDGTEGTRYFRRIVVEPPCLQCHGEKESRPRFVKEGYPEDRAYGFDVGDLRGIYSVFVPDSVALVPGGETSPGSGGKSPADGEAGSSGA
ncbi:MAG: DUF3365 domain-containing protein [Gemmatimonadota bacterium]|nr:DUF3365 domain-containing protein [Gemmatimonadota bacterium]